jgi:hypothetical protein
MPDKFKLKAEDVSDRQIPRELLPGLGIFRVNIVARQEER